MSLDVTSDTTSMSYSQALNDALASEMRRDDRVLILGEDIARYGGVFSVTQGLLEEFGPHRVVDTPISENGIVGAAIGMAMSGLRPVVEIMFADFLSLALDSLANGAAALPFAYGDQVSVPIVVRTQGGMGGNGAGPQHSKSLEAWTAHLPGLHTVAPSSPADAKGLLTGAVRSDEPVVFIEHKKLYGGVGEVPSGEHTVPLGRASIARPGRDVTILTYSWMTSVVLRAADLLAEEGIHVEVVDVRSLRPLDLATIVPSVRRTGRACVVTEAWTRYGPGAELAAAVTESAFDHLKAPVLRLGALGVPLPAAPSLEESVLPSVAEIVRGVADLADVDRRPGTAAARAGAERTSFEQGERA